ncbi:hypothetical protein A2U01_0092206, partial [Trifolium medium]|nr:hypothetical protein [Trifolium medium]
KEGVVSLEGVRVGDVLVRLGGEKGKGGSTGAPEKRASENIGHFTQPTEKETVPEASEYVHKYRPTSEDLTWAQSGVVATFT